MKTIKEAKQRMIVGTRLLCIQNTYRPALNGTYRVVTKMGATTWKYRGDGDEKDSYSVWPSGIKIIDDNTFRLPLCTPFGHRVENHYVDLQFVAE